MQTLASYLASAGRTQSDLARAVGASQSHINKLCHGAKHPSFRMALRIEVETGGAVPVDMWPQFRRTAVPSGLPVVSGLSPDGFLPADNNGDALADMQGGAD